ncbi:MAG: hypothetical protein HYV96_19315 [Opitutae bacterium]|nr:hypothetical protein [Opitutae bacterium]
MKRCPGTTAMVLWVVGSGVASLSGWGLSATGRLDFTHCAVVGTVLSLGGVVALLAAWREVGAAWWRRVARRLTHPLALSWLAVWTLAVAGGVWHAPNNIDALTYRLPRLLHWMSAGGWHWIATDDGRLNFSAAGAEWQIAPLLAILRSDRALFLLNALPSLLLPGLVFSFLHGTGVRRRVAWRWMWLLPMAPTFVLQTGGIGNDLAGAWYFLAAAYFARRAIDRESARWLVVSLVAAALMTGVKTSNLPLLLPYAVIVWPACAVLRMRWRRWCGGVVLALAVSAAPTLWLNEIHSGHWTGDPANLTGVRLSAPWHGWLGNGAQFAVQNLAPPFFPAAGSWNRWSAEWVEPWFRATFAGEFPRFTLRLNEMPQEEWAGLGLLLVVLLAGGWLVKANERAMSPKRGWLIGAAGLVAVLAYAAGMGSDMTARLLTPYYPVLVLPALLASGQAAWCRTRAWSWLVAATVASTAAIVIVAPARPLLPLRAWTDTWRRAHPSATAERVETVYAAYERRADLFGPLGASMPEAVAVVGFMASGDDAETSLWRPYGRRKVARLFPGEAPRDADGAALEWVVVRGDAGWSTPAAMRAWLEHWRGEVVARERLRVKASRADEDWLLVRFSPAGNGAGR